MKRILVPTDFSHCADNAVEFAVQSAKVFPMEVLLAHSFEVKANAYTDYVGVNKEFNQTMLYEATSEFARIRSVIKETEGIDVQSYVSTNSLKESILELTKQRGIDFIVMGTSGASGLKEKLWGSKTADVIEKAPVPVIAIPVDFKWKKPARLLLCTKHFEKDPALLSFVFELANLYKAELHVVVFTDAENDFAARLVEHTKEIADYERLLTSQFENDLTVTHLYGKDFEIALQNYIRLYDIDMLAMFSYKKKFPDSLFHPGVTRRMAYHTKIPMLAIPAGKNAE